MQVWLGCKGPRTPGIIIHLDACCFLIGEPGWSICASNHAVYKQGRGHYPCCVSRHCSLIKVACREAICECSYPNAISITPTYRWLFCKTTCVPVPVPPLPVLIYITGMDAQSSFSTQELSQRAQGQHAKQKDGQRRKRLEVEFCLVKSHFATQANSL